MPSCRGTARQREDESEKKTSASSGDGMFLNRFAQRLSLPELLVDRLRRGPERRVHSFKRLPNRTERLRWPWFKR